jgi:hypothetical protein
MQSPKEYRPKSNPDFAGPSILDVGHPASSSPPLPRFRAPGEPADSYVQSSQSTDLYIWLQVSYVTAGRETKRHGGKNPGPNQWEDVGRERQYKRHTDLERHKKRTIATA